MGERVGLSGGLIFRRRVPSGNPSERRRARSRRILAAFGAIFVLAAALALPVFNELGSDNDFDDPGAEAVQAREKIQAGAGEVASPSVVVLLRNLPGPPDQRAAQARIEQVARGMQVPGVARVVKYESRGDRSLLSKDRRSTILLAYFRGEGDDGQRTYIDRNLAHVPGVVLGGIAYAAPQVNDQISADIARAELIAFPILFLLSLIVFRSAVSALLPLAVGATTILLSGNATDMYWTNAWLSYEAAPTDMSAFTIVDTRLRALYKYLMDLPEYQLS